jgi:maltose alpha-D-glucosyltransferase/alpha-amylase
MLRSFHYAAHSALRGSTSALLMQHSTVPLELWADYWTAWVSAAFLRSYFEAANPGGFLPQDQSQIETLLTVYLLEKAIYELRYEINNRPDWVRIPLEGISQYCDSTKEPAAR